MGKRIGWAVVTVLSLAVGGYAAAIVASGFGILSAEVAGNHFPTALGLRTHIVAAAVALLVGPWQFLRPLRDRLPRVHRWLGRTYVLACLIGGLAGGAIALFSTAGLVAGFGFFGLAIAWLYCTIRGFAAIRARDIVAHRAWMTRSFALTFAAVTLRIYLPIAIITGIGFAPAYPVIAWLCWVPNLIVAQVLVSRIRPAAIPARVLR